MSPTFLVYNVIELHMISPCEVKIKYCTNLQILWMFYVSNRLNDEIKKIMKTRYRNTMYKSKVFELSLFNVSSRLHKYRPQGENKAITSCQYLFSRQPSTLKYIIKYTYIDTYIIYVYLMKPDEIVCRNKQDITVQRRYFSKPTRSLRFNPKKRVLRLLLYSVDISVRR